METNIFKSGGDIAIQEGEQDAKIYNRQAVVERFFDGDNYMVHVRLADGSKREYEIGLSDLLVEGEEVADKEAALTALATVFPNAGAAAIPTLFNVLSADNSAEDGRIVSLGDPENDQDAATKVYVDRRYYKEVTQAEMQDLISDETLLVGCSYKITDVGDRGIILMAVKSNALSKQGRRLMLCPANYKVETDGDGNVWKGVWHPTKSASVDDLMIWGGKVWKNLDGTIGSKTGIRTLDASWELVSKATFGNNEYVEREFGVIYDFQNDFVVTQWDDYGNVFGGMDFLTDSVVGFGGSICDICDWNLVQAGDEGGKLYNNKVFGIFNNHEICNITDNIFSAGLIYENKCLSITQNINCNIKNNSFSDVGLIQQNNNCNIYDNDMLDSSGADIIKNINGRISGNEITAGRISFNVNADIYDNTIDTDDTTAYGIVANRANIIANNTCKTISHNICLNGDIYFNNIPGQLIYCNNVINGITGNTNNGGIANNRNNGHIISCSNNGHIHYNINNGDIANNSSGSSITDSVVNK